MPVYNQDIREIIDNAKKELGINRYHIAYRVGVSESTFARYFRRPMPEKLKKMIIQAVYELRVQSQNTSVI